MTKEEFRNKWNLFGSEFDKDLASLLKERAVEFIKYCDKQDGVDWVDPDAYPEWYDEFIKQQP